MLSSYQPWLLIITRDAKVDRDNNPQWKPATIGDLLESNLSAEIMKRFEPTKIQDGLLGDTSETPELEILTWEQIRNNAQIIDHLLP